MESTKARDFLRNDQENVRLILFEARAMPAEKRNAGFLFNPFQVMGRRHKVVEVDFAP